MSLYQRLKEYGESHLLLWGLVVYGLAIAGLVSDSDELTRLVDVFFLVLGADMIREHFKK